MSGEEDEWEYEDEEEEEEAEKEPEGKAEITISGNLIKIDRSKVDWSSDEEEEEDEKPSAVPAPPPPPPPPMAPPPPPLPPGGLNKSKSDRLEQLKKRPTKRPDWNELMQEVEAFRYGFTGKLSKTQTNDRSRPILTNTKVKGVFVYESEKDSKNADILKEIQRGAKLRHVKCNDRSKPNLRGIRSFKRQLTKEEKKEGELTFDDNVLDDNEDNEDVIKLKDDLESTQQLLELEVRSKQLLDKNNKKLQSEIEQLRSELSRYQNTNGISSPEGINERKNSVKEKRKSVIRTISESASEGAAETNGLSETPIPPELPEEAMIEIEELKEEAEEARKIAEEWEIKYKEMQRQLEDLDELKKLAPELNGVDDSSAHTKQNDNEEDWLRNREINQLQTKIRNTKDKKEFIERERKFLNERLENLKESISQEIEARKRLRKEVREMNAAFRKEMAELEELEKLDEELDDVYIEEGEDLVDNRYKDDSEDGEETPEEEEVEEEDENLTLDDVIRSAEEMMEICEEDTGITLFFVNTDVAADEAEIAAKFDDDYEGHKEELNKRLEAHTENIQLMRKSNFTLKSKIDVLMDLLQVQKEKHLDLKQELNRMLIDIG